jgi:hypothetical protein
MERKCESCEFWREFSQKSGECLRNAPSPSRYSDSTQNDEHQRNDSILSGTRWPMTYSDQWCGEFKEKHDE